MPLRILKNLSIDISPLVKYRDFRLLYFGQAVSFLGTMITTVAIPYHMYEITKSTFAVGLLGVFQLLPLVVIGFWGGVLADAVDRRKLIALSELGLALTCGFLTYYSTWDQNEAWVLYLVAGVMSGLNGIHRPSLEALTPRLVPRNEIPRVSPLNSLRHNIGMIAGPGIAGIIIAKQGVFATYLLDALTYVLSLIALLLMRNVPAAVERSTVSLKSVLEGFRYAMSRQDLIGTYVVDMVAMTFAMPNALFPAIADQVGGPEYLGWLYSSVSIGALMATLTSGWTPRVYRHGLVILISASAWCVAMIAFGFVSSFPLLVAFLIIAGFADMISGIFRATIWNQTIPDSVRGRLASVEMISYTSGPLLGNTQSGFLASIFGPSIAISTSATIGLFGIGMCAHFLPRFRSFDARTHPRS